MNAEYLKPCAVEVYVGGVIQFPEGGDGLQADSFRQSVVEGNRCAPRLQPLQVVEIRLHCKGASTGLKTRSCRHQRWPLGDAHGGDGTVGIIDRAVNRQADAQILIGFIVKLRPPSKGVLVAIGPVRCPGKQISAVAVMRNVAKGNAGQQALAGVQRAAPNPLQPIFVILAGGNIRLKQGSGGGGGGNVLQRAADGVAPIEGALRPAQHLHPLHVYDIQERALRPAQIHVVQVNANTWVSE